MGLQTKISRCVFFSECHRACLVTVCYQQEKGRDCFESFFPTCSNSTIRIVLALTAVHGWYAVDLCVLLFQLTLLCESVSAWKDQLLEVLLRITAYTCSSTSTASCTHLVQAPRQYYMLCREVYQKVSLKQLQTDECV